MVDSKKLMKEAEKKLQDDVRRFNLDVLEEFTLIEVELVRAGGGATRSLAARIPMWVTELKRAELGDRIRLAVGRKVKKRLRT